MTKMIITALCALLLSACDVQSAKTSSASGVTAAKVTIAKGADGFTTEQRNVGERLKEDNKVGSIKHLYVVSAYSGQVIMYSTVRGKVSSSGKRLTPATIVVGPSGESRRPGFGVSFGGREMTTSEVLHDDGTYGSSMDYLFWWDTKGVYHQHYVTGGQILHVSSEPIAVKSVIINISAPVKD